MQLTFYDERENVKIADIGNGMNEGWNFKISKDDVLLSPKKMVQKFEICGLQTMFFFSDVGKFSFCSLDDHSGRSSGVVISRHVRMADDGRGGVVRGGHWNRHWNAPVAVFRLLDRHFGLDRLVLSRLVAHLSFFLRKKLMR